MSTDLNDPLEREARRLERTRQRIRASRAKWSSVRSNLGASILTAMLSGAKATLQEDVTYCREARDNPKLSKSDRATAAVVAGAHLNDLLGAALDAFVDMKRERRLEYLNTYISAVPAALAAASTVSVEPADEAPAGLDNPPHDAPQAAHDDHAVHALANLDDLALHLADASATDGGV
ncbi:hypothetical protein [Burkholderia glumae]|uniref:hypothetical protein n=1 Tax=Burkholderia glumae TaxID=337 RepID=UPI00031FD4BB|nr:hypothetical protein [Burkholderia glumae]PJO21677.1 hypothetical protein Y5A_018430 [Burkholderia glumae AU6208]QHE10622.1 hypothetical protein GQR88_09555 [Burkholderia glumae AU6208]